MILFITAMSDDQNIDNLFSYLEPKNLYFFKDLPRTLWVLSKLIPTMSTEQLDRMTKLLRSIESIYFGGGHTNDFHDLIFSNLTNVQSLSMGSSYYIKNLDFILRFPNLKELSMHCEKLTDIDVLGQLIHLEHLELYNLNNVTNIDFLSKLPNLSRLDLYNLDKVTSVDNINVLSRLTHLKYLKLKNIHNISDEQKLFDLICALINLPIKNIIITSFAMNEQLVSRLKDMPSVKLETFEHKDKDGKIHNLYSLCHISENL